MRKEPPAIVKCRMLFPRLCLGCLAVVVTGCATMVNGPTQTIRIASSPANATVTLNDQVIGQTPLVYEISRSKKGVGYLEISREGYEPQRFKTYRRVSGAFWGNLGFLVVGGIPLMLFDGITGCWANVYPHNLNVQLDEIKAPKIKE